MAGGRNPITIADMMIMSVGAAVSFAAWRSVTSMPVWEGFPDSLQLLYFRAIGCVAFLEPFSWTLLVLALKGPRSRLRRAVREPAAVVGLSAAFVFVANTAILVASMALTGWSVSRFTDGKVLYFCRLLAEQTGMVIGAAWLTGAIAGWTRRRMRWMDVTAWLVGAAWFLLALASSLFTLM